MNNPKVSIIVPCYNQAQYLSEALQSVLGQTYENWECIIVNDGSPDNTKEVAQEWVKKDSRFIYLYKENGGLSSARNAGLDIAKGDYVQFLDADDILQVEKLEVTLKKVEKIADFSHKIVITNFRMFIDDIHLSSNPFCELKQEYFTFQQLLIGWDYLFNIPIHCGFFQKDFFVSFRFPENLKAKEDWIMWLSFFKMEPNVVFVDKVLAYYRIQSHSMTNNRQFMNEALLEALIYIDSMVTKEMFHTLLLTRLKLSFTELNSFEKKYRKVKNSNSFKVGLKIKTILQRFHLLNFSRKIVKLLK